MNLSGVYQGMVWRYLRTFPQMKLLTAEYLDGKRFNTGSEDAG